MKELIRIFKTFIGYIIRPDLYPELGRKIFKNVFHRKNAFKGKEQALEWSKKLAISEEQALIEITNGAGFSDIKEIYPTILSNAKIKQDECPVIMGGAGALNILYYLSEKLQAKTILETGVAYGWSSLAFLLSLEKRNGTLYSSDLPYLSQNGDNHVGVVVDESLKKNWKLYRFADKESLPKIFNEINEIDISHYDSDKSYDGRMWAYKEIWNKTRKGGVFISDDIADNGAFMDWCNENKLTPTIIDFEEKYIGWVYKN